MDVIQFKKKGYDGFIDFIKAYAIIAVLIGHTIPYLDYVFYNAWLGMQVPLFILVQTFHSYKKEHVKLNLGKAFLRVFVPFLILELLTFTIVWIGGGQVCNLLINSALIGGGFGPGSYYPWVYLQIAILLPLFSIILRRYSKVMALVLFLILCEGLEVLSSIINIPDFIYRLLAVRYLFLIWLGYLWVKEGIVLNWKTIIISILSLGAIIYFEYFSINDEPYFFSTGWKCHRYPCYFFVAYGLTALLNVIWKHVNNSVFILKVVKSLASSSYEIFLIQMSALFLFQWDDLAFLNNKSLQFFVWLLIIWTLSIAGGILIRNWHNRIKKKRIVRN